MFATFVCRPERAPSNTGSRRRLRQLPHLSFGDSEDVQVGQWVLAVGNPGFGSGDQLDYTVTAGIVSARGRALNILRRELQQQDPDQPTLSGYAIEDFIQTDAVINPGNSGGPMVSLTGQVVGINSAIASNTGQSAGVGFAIPVNLCTRVLPQLIRHGRVFRPEIGVQQVYETDQGLLIARLVPGGPAERAGLRGPAIDRRRRGPFLLERVDRSAADLIVAVDGEEVKTADDFLGLIERHEAGERVVLTILREGRKMNVPVTLGGEQP